MSYVFISYSRKDSVFVDRLMQDLQQAGIETWRDTEQIVAGSRWDSAILEAVLEAGALLHVASANSFDSEWINQEINMAMDRQIRVIPVIIDDLGATRLPFALRRLQWLDFRQDYQAAFQHLLNALPDSVRREHPLPDKPLKSKGYVFISYAEEDSPFVNLLKGFLKEKKYGYWDYQESNRDYHTQLFLELESIIREASATLTILSPDWKRSKWTPKEYLFSEDVGTPVFLLMAREMGPTLVTSGIPYIDFVRDADRGFDRLDRELQRKGLI